MTADNPHPLWRKKMKEAIAFYPQVENMEKARELIREYAKSELTYWDGRNADRYWQTNRFVQTIDSAEKAWIIDAAMNQTAQSAPVDLEDAPRIECQFCGSDYNVMWKGTTCSVCDGIIGETAQSEVKA